MSSPETVFFTGAICGLFWIAVVISWLLTSLAQFLADSDVKDQLEKERKEQEHS